MDLVRKLELVRTLRIFAPRVRRIRTLSERCERCEFLGYPLKGVTPSEIRTRCAVASCSEAKTGRGPEIRTSRGEKRENCTPSASRSFAEACDQRQRWFPTPHPEQLSSSRLSLGPAPGAVRVEGLFACDLMGKRFPLPASLFETTSARGANFSGAPHQGATYAKFDTHAANSRPGIAPASQLGAR